MLKPPPEKGAKRSCELWGLNSSVNPSKKSYVHFFFFFPQSNELSSLLKIFICTSSIIRVFRLPHLFPTTSCNFQCWMLYSKSGQHNLHVLISDSSTYLKILRMNHIYMFAEFLLLPVKEGSHWRTVEQSSRQETLMFRDFIWVCSLKRGFKSVY